MDRAFILAVKWPVLWTRKFSKYDMQATFHCKLLILLPRQAVFPQNQTQIEPASLATDGFISSSVTHMITCGY